MFSEAAHVRRAEQAADRIADLARSAEPGTRLGTKGELRALCGVSVSTFNEALRLLQARGLVSVRPGPGGGLFVAEQSPMVRLSDSMLALDAEQTSVAEAIRIRDALDPLLIEDALWHSSPADIAEMRVFLDEMGRAAEAEDATAFARANWRLHARISATSPQPLLRSLYTGLLELIEAHTIKVVPDGVRPLPSVLRERHRLHADIVDAIARHDRDAAMRLIHEHRTSEPPTPAT